MECLKCARQMRRKVMPMKGFYEGETFTVRTAAMACPHCGFSTVAAPDLDEYLTAVADAFRVAHGLLTSPEIRAARKRLDLSQRAFARYLGVGEASVKRWELGKVQDRGMDELMRLKTSASYAASSQKGLASMVADASSGERREPYTIPVRVFRSESAEIAELRATILRLEARIEALTRKKRRKRRAL